MISFLHYNIICWRFEQPLYLYVEATNTLLWGRQTPLPPESATNLMIMCVMRKPRVSYTLEEDVAMMREVTAAESGVLGGGSAASKLEAWTAVAERVVAKGVDVTGDGLRRHVADLVKKFKRQGPEPAGGRMRWGAKAEMDYGDDALVDNVVGLGE
jgi:hypothetical protein